MKKVLLLLFLPACVSAAPKTVFSCVTETGRQVSVIDNNGTYRYTFGKPGRKPELVFTNSKKQIAAQTPPGKSYGRTQWSQMVLKNGRYYYRFFVGADLVEARSWAGLEVRKVGFREIRNEVCSKKHPVQVDFDAEIDRDGSGDLFYYDE